MEFWQDGRVVGTHARVFGSNKAVYGPHDIPVLARKPGALRNGAPFKEWELPPAMRRVQRKLGSVPNGDRQMVDILGGVLIDGIEAVEAACAEALAEGVHSAGVILNILARQREPAPPLTIATPEALRLTCEPAADCARYDSLRRPDHGKIAGSGRDEPVQALRQWRAAAIGSRAARHAAYDEIMTTGTAEARAAEDRWRSVHRRDQRD